MFDAAIAEDVKSKVAIAAEMTATGWEDSLMTIPPSQRCYINVMIAPYSLLESHGEWL
jgi:hypothetical protein